MNKLHLILACFVLLLGAVSSASGPYVVNPAGMRIDGVAIESGDDGTIRLTTATGQVLTFQPGSYQQAVAGRPAEMDRVEALARAREFDEAAALLRQVKARYRSLAWDVHAGRMLARVELARGRFDEALDEYDALFSLQPALRGDPAERLRYMQALLGAGRSDDLSVLIDEDIASGSRAAAARAQLLRGDMKSAAGLHREALLDYLRTALLFSDQPATLPEATYKTAAALRILNDPRADQWVQRVLDRFPESEFADRIRKENTP